MYFLFKLVKQSAQSYSFLSRTRSNNYSLDADRCVYSFPRPSVALLLLSDVRLAPKNYAFIEYEDEFKAGNALSALN
jgi:hypothetical protein